MITRQFIGNPCSLPFYMHFISRLGTNHFKSSFKLATLPRVHSRMIASMTASLTLLGCGQFNHGTKFAKWFHDHDASVSEETGSSPEDNNPVFRRAKNCQELHDYHRRMSELPKIATCEAPDPALLPHDINRQLNKPLNKSTNESMDKPMYSVQRDTVIYSAGDAKIITYNTVTHKITATTALDIDPAVVNKNPYLLLGEDVLIALTYVDRNKWAIFVFKIDANGTLTDKKSIKIPGVYPDFLTARVKDQKLFFTSHYYFDNLSIDPAAPNQSPLDGVSCQDFALRLSLLQAMAGNLKDSVQVQPSQDGSFLATGFAGIHKVNLQDPNLEVKSTFYSSSTMQQIVGPNFEYFVDSDSDLVGEQNQQQSILFDMDYESNRLMKSFIKIDGSIRNARQLNFDSSTKVLSAVAFQSRSLTNPEWHTSVLSIDMNKQPWTQIGASLPFGINEAYLSSHFQSGFAFVATGVWTDPIIAVDLRQPRDLKITSQLTTNDKTTDLMTWNAHSLLSIGIINGTSRFDHRLFLRLIDFNTDGHLTAGATWTPNVDHDPTPSVTQSGLTVSNDVAQSNLYLDPENHSLGLPVMRYDETTDNNMKCPREGWMFFNVGNESMKPLGHQFWDHSPSACKYYNNFRFTGAYRTGDEMVLLSTNAIYRLRPDDASVIETLNFP